MKRKRKVFKPSIERDAPGRYRIDLSGAKLDPVPVTIPMLLWCPECHVRHIDRGEWTARTHHTHACQSCGHVWRPAIVPTIGVQFLPGFKNE